MKIKVDSLRFSYGTHEVLKGVSFSAEKGEFLSVLGPNGVGKTTLFQCLLGNLNDYTGTIRIDGKDSSEMSEKERAKRLAYIPQIQRSTFNYTAFDMVLMGTTRGLNLFAKPGAKEGEIAMNAMSLLGIEDFKDRGFNELSGGEQQLVLIARALAQQSDILIMDEPTASLDYGNQHRVLECVRGLTEEGYTVLLSTHHPQHALTFADRILALSDGRAAAVGRPEEVMTKELLDELYRIDVDFLETENGSVILPHAHFEKGSTHESK